MEDAELVKRIGELVDEEHALERSHVGKGASDEDIAKIQAIEVALDQCWDLLRQRQARRDAGQNPDDATVRDASTVEGYQQ
ncbi:MAG: hypothetical protein QOF21_1439 [Actinomycetota bacterium]|jgi:hypothetical protein